jgi:hypothetical protein
MTNAIVDITINQKTCQIEPGLVKGSQILEKAGVVSPKQLLFEVDGDIDIPVGPNDHIIINGGEAFSIGDGDPPIEDNPCLRKPIRFKFNGKKIDESDALENPKVLGSELKAFDPDGEPSDGLFADIKDFADEPIPNDWRIIVQPSDEFITTPCGNVGDLTAQNGIVSIHFTAVQEAYPHAEWHTHPAGNALVVRDVVLPEHWSVDKADILIIVPNGYPMAALDMFYVSPHIKLSNGQVPEAGNSFEDHIGKKWQRFSWHYKSRKWNPAKDTMLSHINFCLKRLKIEK